MNKIFITESLNIYKPTFFSLFSIFIRISGYFLFLGILYLFLFNLNFYFYFKFIFLFFFWFFLFLLFFHIITSIYKNNYKKLHENTIKINNYLFYFLIIIQFIIILIFSLFFNFKFFYFIIYLNYFINEIF